MNKKVEKFRKFKDSLQERLKDSEYARIFLEVSLEELQRDIRNLTRKGVNEFIAHYGMSQNDFAAYLAEMYPRLEPKERLHLVELSETERQKIADQGVSTFKERKDVDAMRRTLNRLEAKKERLSNPERIDMSDQLRELYVPLFAADRDKCDVPGADRSCGRW